MRKKNWASMIRNWTRIHSYPLYDVSIFQRKNVCESITDCNFQKVLIAQVWYNITCPNKNKSNCYGQAILQRTGLFSAFKSMFSSLILIDSNSLIAFLEARLSYVNINGVFLCDVCARDLAQCTEIGIFDGGLYLSKLSPYLN